MLPAAGLASLLGAIAALIQLQGPALKPGILAGSVALPLERAAGGDTRCSACAATGGRCASCRYRRLVHPGVAGSGEAAGPASTPIPPADFGLAGAGKGCDTLRPRRTSLPPLNLLTQTLKAGGLLSLSGVEALVLPVGGLPPDVDGVLGAPQLRQLPLWIDPLGGVWPSAAVPCKPRTGPPLLIRRRHRSSGAEGEATIPLRWHRGVPLLSLATGSRAGMVEALADTGAEGLFVSPELAAVLPALGPSQPLRVAGFCGEQPASMTRVQGPSLTGRRPAAPVQVILTTNPVFQSLGVKAIVGQELLRPHRQLWRLESPPPTLHLQSAPAPADRGGSEPSVCRQLPA